jgi:hypothetical protein
MKHNNLIPAQDPPQERYPNRFKPGTSGNPGGRPKKTAAELKAVEKMKKLTPEAVDVVEGILKNSKASFYARLQAAQIIFDRAMGRPDTFLKVYNAEQSVAASSARLQSLFGSADDEDDESDECAESDEGDESEADGPDETDENSNSEGEDDDLPPASEVSVNAG